MPKGPSTAPQAGADGFQFEQELDEQLRALEQALQADPGSAPMQRAVEIAREQRVLVRSLVDQAVRYEDEGRLDEALQRWKTLLTVHPEHDEVEAQVGRLSSRLESQPEPAAGAARAGANDVVRKLTDSVASLELGNRSRQILEEFKKRNLKESVEEVGAALGWMQAQVERKSDQPTSATGDPPAPRDKPEGKPVWVFLAGGIAAAALLAMFVGQGGGDRTPGPAPLIRDVTVQAAPGETQIFVDGEPCGVGTCNLQLEAGLHEISGRLPGYGAARQPVAIDPADEEQTYAVRLALEPLAPALDLSVDLESAQVSIDGEAAGRIEDGALRLEILPFGEHEVRLASGRLGMRFVYRSEPGKPIELTEPLEATEMKAALAAALGDQVRLYSAAEDATVRVNGGPPKEAPRTGLVLAGLSYGSHEAVFSDGSSVAFETDARPTLAVSLTSDRNVGALRVTTGVDGATVYLNGKPYRRKTARGGLLVYLAPRPFKVRVEKDGFRSPKEETVEVVKGRRVSLEMLLEPQPQTAVLYVRGGQAGASVALDGKVIGRLDGDGDLRLPGIEQGTHTVEIRLDGYEAKEIRREFPSDSEVRVDGALELITGTLQIRISPANVQPRLRLAQEGQVGSRAIDSLELNLPPGTYTVSADAPGYKPYSATVRVEAGGRKSAAIQLEKVQLTAPKPRDLIPALDRLGWSRHGEMRVRSGGGFVVAPAGPGPGVYRFTVLRQRGKLLWAVGYRDSNNHVLYQVRKDEVVRTVVKDGDKVSETTVARGSYDLNNELTFRIEIQSGQATIWLSRGGDWSQVDQFQEPGIESGRFAFNLSRSRMLGRTDQLGVREFSFTPAE